MRRLVSYFAIAVLLLTLIACGSNSSSSSHPMPPTFTSTAPAAAQEGVAYSYTVAATDPSGGTVNFALTSGPAGATLSGDKLSWTPTHTESRVANAFVITATSSANTSATQSFSVTPNGNVNGSVIEHAITGAGLVNFPEDLSTATIEALVPANSGGYTTLTGTGDANGNFSISNVPAGNCWIHLSYRTQVLGTVFAPNNNYFWTDASDLDAGALRQGRPNPVRLATGATIAPNLSLTVTPQANDGMAWSSPDASGGPFIAARSPVSNPFTAPFGPNPSVTIDASQGDRAFMLHYANFFPVFGLAPSGTQTLEEYLEDDSVTETDGATISVSGTMTPATGLAIHPVIQFSQFDTMIPTGATPLSGAKSITITDPLYDGSQGGGGGIILVQHNFDSSTGDVDLGDLTTGLLSNKDNPTVTVQDSALLTFPVGTINLRTIAGSRYSSATMPDAAHPIVPLLTLPQSPTIDGKDLLSAQTNLSLTPQIAWTSPAMGTPSYYVVSVIQLNTTNPPISIANFLTTATSFTLPPSILQSGTSFVVTIEAVAVSANNFATAPFRHGTESSTATLASALMSTTAPATPGPRKQLPASAEYRILRNSDSLPYIETVPKNR